MKSFLLNLEDSARKKIERIALNEKRSLTAVIQLAIDKFCKEYKRKSKND